MPSRPSTQAASSRERLLKAAKRLFAAQGYEHTATSAIARAAGTSESQLMRYFGGKVGLLDALFDAAWDDLNRRVERGAAKHESARAAILGIVDNVMAALARDPEQAALFLFEARRMRGGSRRVRVSSGYTAFSDALKATVRRGVTTKEFSPHLNATAVTAAVLGAVESMLRERVMARSRGARVFGEREIRRTLDAMLSGFETVSAPRRA
jgi:AcrR family transcriptional regulator